MSKYRIKCNKCGWTTNPYYSEIYCIQEKEVAHKFGIIKHPDKDAHDAAFGTYCPECGSPTITEHRYFK